MNKSRSRNRVRSRGILQLEAQPATLLSMGPAGLPRKLKVVHRYCETEVFTNLAGAISTRRFSCNGMYDPDVVGGGHQPAYFDQLGALYDQYIVLRSSMKISLITTNSTNLSVAFYIDDDTSSATPFDNAAEQSGSKPRLIPSNNTRPTIFRQDWDARKFFGGDIFDNTDLHGTTSGNPTEQSYFTLLVSEITGAAAFNYCIQYEIVYEAVWDELKTITLS